jgi:hypothetical protein
VDDAGSSPAAGAINLILILGGAGSESFFHRLFLFLYAILQLGVFLISYSREIRG